MTKIKYNFAVISYDVYVLVSVGRSHVVSQQARASSAGLRGRDEQRDLPPAKNSLPTPRPEILEKLLNIRFLVINKTVELFFKSTSLASTYIDIELLAL